MWLSIHCIHESIALFNCPVRDAAVTCFDLSFAHEHNGASVPHRSCGCGCHCTPQIAHHREITVAWQWFLSPPETRHDKTTDKSKGLKRLKPNETETERCRKVFPNLSTVSDPVHGFSRVTVSGHELQSYAHEDLSQGIGKLNQEKELWRSLLQRLKPSQTISNHLKPSQTLSEATKHHAFQPSQRTCADYILLWLSDYGIRKHMATLSRCVMLCQALCHDKRLEAVWRIIDAFWRSLGSWQARFASMQRAPTRPRLCLSTDRVWKKQKLSHSW